MYVPNLLRTYDITNNSATLTMPLSRVAVSEAVSLTLSADVMVNVTLDVTDSTRWVKLDSPHVEVGLLSEGRSAAKCWVSCYKTTLALLLLQLTTI